MFFHRCNFKMSCFSELDKLESDIAELKSHCEALQGSIDSNIGDYERQLLETLDRIKVVRQAYHGDVFNGNHCKLY